MSNRRERITIQKKTNQKQISCNIALNEEKWFFKWKQNEYSHHTQCRAYRDRHMYIIVKHIIQNHINNTNIFLNIFPLQRYTAWCDGYKLHKIYYLKSICMVKSLRCHLNKLFVIPTPISTAKTTKKNNTWTICFIIFIILCFRLSLSLSPSSFAKLQTKT